MATAYYLHQSHLAAAKRYVLKRLITDAGRAQVKAAVDGPELVSVLQSLGYGDHQIRVALYYHDWHI